MLNSLASGHLALIPTCLTTMSIDPMRNPRCWSLNPFKPEFTIVIFIHYKPRIAVAIPDLKWMKMIWSGWKIKENCHVLVNQFHGNFHSKTVSCRKMKSVFMDVKWCFNASWGLKGLILSMPDAVLLWWQTCDFYQTGNGFLANTRIWSDTCSPRENV